MSFGDGLNADVFILSKIKHMTHIVINANRVNFNAITD